MIFFIHLMSIQLNCHLSSVILHISSRLFLSFCIMACINFSLAYYFLLNHSHISWILIHLFLFSSPLASNQIFHASFFLVTAFAILKYVCVCAIGRGQCSSYHGTVQQGCSPWYLTRGLWRSDKNPENKQAINLQWMGPASW